MTTKGKKSSPAVITTTTQFEFSRRIEVTPINDVVSTVDSPLHSSTTNPIGFSTSTVNKHSRRILWPIGCLFITAGTLALSIMIIGLIIAFKSMSMENDELLHNSPIIHDIIIPIQLNDVIDEQKLKTIPKLSILTTKHIPINTIHSTEINSISTTERTSDFSTTMETTSSMNDADESSDSTTDLLTSLATSVHFEHSTQSSVTTSISHERTTSMKLSFTKNPDHYRPTRFKMFQFLPFK